MADAPFVDRLRFTAQHGLFKASDENMHASFSEARDVVSALLEALEEVLNYSGGAVSALEDDYVVARAQDAIARARGAS